MGNNSDYIVLCPNWHLGLGLFCLFVSIVSLTSVSLLLKVYNKVQKTKLGACWVQSLESCAQHVYPVTPRSNA